MLIVLAYMFLGSFSVVPPGKNPVDMAPAIDPTYYLHRTLPQTPIPVPFGLRMNTTAPPPGADRNNPTIQQRHQLLLVF